VETLEALGAAVSRFPAAAPSLEVTAAARAAAGRSLAGSGLLLLGEMHGVSENPLLIRALMAEFGLTSLGLEWPAGLTPVITAFLATGTLAAHDWLWLGDGRITAGHLAVLAAMTAAGPLDLVLFDDFGSLAGGWSDRDAAMARRLLAAVPAGGAGTLVVAGNAHTPTGETELGVPLGAQLARQRPGVREIRIRYGSGAFWNLGPSRFGPVTDADAGPPRLSEQDGELVLDLPVASEATVPQRPLGTLRPGPGQ
jgi:hypothetical protein